MTEERTLPLLSNMVDQLGSVIAGIAAEPLALAGTTIETGNVFVLPSWVWLLPKIDVGRKGLARDGSRTVRMPIRIVYPDGPVFISGAPEFTTAARLVGLGWDEDINVSVLISAGTGVHVAEIAGEEMSPVVRGFLTPGMFRRSLDAVMNAGRTARWDVISSLENFTQTRLVTANTTVAAELGEYTEHAIPYVLDHISLESLLSQLIHGEGGSSVVSRMVDRALNPDTFRRVDPMRYFAVSIRARSEEAVRRAIGDPKVGPKVRRIFLRTNPKTIDELLVAYKAAYPRDSLAKGRAIAALTAGAELSAYQSEFRDSVLAGVNE